MKIPGYDIRHEIGSGGMATVYLAIQESLHRKVALKVMSPALAADKSYTGRFLKEARTIAQLVHPNIVAIHDVGVEGYYHYLALEYIPGGDLKQRIRQGMTPAEALDIVRQIAGALEHAHQKGIIHRDVKPENILFRDDGSAVLTDFGIARAVDGKTRMTGTGMSIGTPHYMSPEQARGKNVDGRSDLYGLGIVLYEMLTGEVPYDAPETLAIGIKHITEPVPRLTGKFADYQPLIDGLLAKEPEQRFRNNDALCAAMDLLARRANEGNCRATNQTVVRPVVEAPKKTVVMSVIATAPGCPLPPAKERFIGLGWLRVVAILGILAVLTSFLTNLQFGTSRGLRDSILTKTTDQIAALEPEMVVIPAGSFEMGSNDDDSEQPVHSVRILKPFAMARTEVTQRQWREVMGSNPSKFLNCGDHCPVENVSWVDTQNFIQKLNNKSGKTYRLPSESEWEYSCRAGGRYAYCGGDGLDGVAWYGSNSGSTTHPVAQRQANAWGLYDMSGNVHEWVGDCSMDNYNGAPTDGSARTSGDCSRRILRGGSWIDDPKSVRSASRMKYNAVSKNIYHGFRLAMNLP